MPISHLLPDFALEDAAQATQGTESAATADMRLEAFENGYNAGWEDAGKAAEGNHARISDALAANLADLGFTYHEAYSHMLTALHPLIEQIVSTVLPELAQKTLGARLSEELHQIGRRVGRIPVRIATAPEEEQAVTGCLPPESDLPVEVVADPALGPGQLELRFGQAERMIDLQEVLSEIDAATQGFFAEQKKDATYG